MVQLFQKQNSMRALSFFLENPRKELYLREIARKIKMSPSSLARVLSLLEKEKLVEKRKDRNATYYRAVMSNYFKALKLAYTLSKIQDAKIIELMESKSNGLSCILLYGSSAKGTDESGSDYDFLVIASNCRVSGLEIGERLGRESNLQLYTISEWEIVSRKNRAFYLEIISNCIALRGEKPVID